MNNPKLQALEPWLLEATIDDIQDKFKSGELTSSELVRLYLSRIARIDQNGPKLNSILEINPEALHIARVLDQERELKGPRGPLHGIPVVIKDNIDTHDKMHTSAGSLALQDSIAPKDAHIVSKLREAGAIILAKTNLTEWANFMTVGMKNGYSSRGGQVLNPYGPGTFDVGGSSAGTGAAIAANLATVGIGTETSGSILSPSSQNSLVGIKPTVGLVSRSGIIPISNSQDTAGPMARTVKDAAFLLNVIASADAEDSITFSCVDHDIDYTDCLRTDGIDSFCIGIQNELITYLDEEKQEIIKQAIQSLKEMGAIIKENVSIPSMGEKWDINVMLHEFKVNLNAYLSSLSSRVSIKTLKDVIEFNWKHEDRTLKYGQSLLIDSEKTSGKLTDAAYLNSLEHDLYYSKEGGIDQLFTKEGLDILVSPNNYGAMIPAKAGYPSITVPCGYTTSGEPVGITFTGTAFSEPFLIHIAYAFEQKTKCRQAPCF